MRNTVKKLAGTAAAAVAMLALAAPAAMADAAYWSSTSNGIKWTGTLTLEKDGGSAKTCTTNTALPGEFYGEWFIARSSVTDHLRLNCPGNTRLDMIAQGLPGYNEASFSEFLLNVSYGVGIETSPYGNWYQEAFPVEFTNASGGTPSQIEFDDTLIGYTTSMENITATGTLNVTNNSGGALTLSQ